MFIDCFKYYTVFHLVPPICSGALLFYLFKLEGRLEPVFIMIIITGTQQSFMYCLFGNVLNYEVTIGEFHPFTLKLFKNPFPVQRVSRSHLQHAMVQSGAEREDGFADFVNWRPEGDFLQSWGCL